MAAPELAIEVDYRFPVGVDAERQARVIAIGQTAGTWDAAFTHRDAELRSHLAEVAEVRTLADGRGLATLRFPERNVEGDVPTLLTMIFGKYSMAGPAKIVDVRLPPGYGLKPRLGLAGIRARTGAWGRPLVMAIIKPAFGLRAEEHAAIVEEVAAAGLDIVKDDEILGDVAESPTLARVRACRRAIDASERATGRRLLHAVNLTGRHGRLVERARALVGEGANALLLNLLPYGFAALEALAQDPAIDVPIFVHPALAGAFCGAPDHGLAYPVVLGTLAARAGADAVLYPAHHGSLPFRAEDERGIRSILGAWGVLPVPSAGIHPGAVPRVLAEYGVDVALNAGTGIMEHPLGRAAGVAAFREAVGLALSGTPPEPGSLPDGALRAALEKWGWS